MIHTLIATLDVKMQIILDVTNSRLTSDLATDRESIPAGETRFSIHWSHTGREYGVDSNASYYGYVITIWARHKLADATDERAYTQSAASRADLTARALGDQQWWLQDEFLAANPDVYGFQSGDAFLTLTEPEREGNIISFSAHAKLLTF